MTMVLRNNPSELLPRADGSGMEFQDIVVVYQALTPGRDDCSKSALRDEFQRRTGPFPDLHGGHHSLRREQTYISESIETIPE